MKQHILKTTLLISAITLTLAACKKDDPPVPAEQELITTLRLNITGGAGFAKTFNYKIENGFGSNDPGSVQVDTITLAPNSIYAVTVQVLNEKAFPVVDVTQEVIDEKEKHLFLFNTVPATGAGSIIPSNGSVDSNSLPFNQVVSFSTGSTGSSKLTVNLMHEPTNKNGTFPAASGGETDVEAVFPVKLQ